MLSGHHKYSTHARKLFRVLDPYNAGKAKWRQLVAKLEAVGAKKTGSKRDRWNRITCGEIMKMEHCKRETIVKLVNIEREDAFCYVAVSKGGRIGIYCANLKLLHKYEVFYHRTGVRGRVKNCWITDAVYLSINPSRFTVRVTPLRNRTVDLDGLIDVQYLMYSASDRSLTVYDATTLSHHAMYCITGMPNIPTELTTPPHTSYLSITTWRRVHSRSIRRLAHARGGDILLSCSHDSTVSVRAKHVPGKLDDYVFKVQRGVSCFHVVYPLHLLATGSIDGAVRLWETSQSSPFAILQAPSSPAVLDVAIVPGREAVVAHCNNCTIHIWDIYEECLLQTIKIKFPFLGVLGKKVEFGAYSIFPGPIYKPFEEIPSEIPPRSRRPSSVVQASTGGLILQPESDLWQTPGPQQPEYVRFNRSTLLITCCDHICVLQLSEPCGRPPSAPGDTLTPRRPSAWDLPEFADLGKPAPSSSPSPIPTPSLPSPSPGLLAPSTAEFPLHDLETLLDNAGLHGILEKDFVLMQGLKHDLNKKLADMETNKQAMRSAVSMGAPYLSLRTYPPIHMEPVDEMNEEYRRIMKLFPGSSVAATPTNSEMSTPRNDRTQKIIK